MKYLKLFEQFEDDEDGWWDDESPFDFSYTLITDKLGYTAYVAKYNKKNDTYTMFDNYPAVTAKHYILWNKHHRSIDPHTIVGIYDKNNKYGGKFEIRKAKDWKYYFYRDLPREIRGLMI